MAMYESEYCILREETVRERRGSYSEFFCRLYPFICWIIIKEGPDNFSGGRSPHWVNHVNLCGLRPPEKLSGPSISLVDVAHTG